MRLLRMAGELGMSATKLPLCRSASLVFYEREEARPELTREERPSAQPSKNLYATPWSRDTRALCVLGLALCVGEANHCRQCRLNDKAPA
jgi:hypothetical protein